MKHFDDMISRIKDAQILWVILFIAAILRLLFAWDFSFSPNELSLIETIKTEGLTALFNKTDYTGTFPSGFLFFHFLWIKLTGTSEFFVRLPSIAASVASVYLTFRIAKGWFNSYTGLFSAALLAVLQFPILYAQQALPFSFGLFFVLLSVLLWGKALFENPENKFRPFVFFALSLGVTGYFQNFALLISGIIVITGFFFVTKSNYKKYIVSIIIAAVLFQPEIFILLKNIKLMNISESGGWIVKPESNMFFKFIYYCFNQSKFLIYGIFVFFVYSNIDSFGKFKFTKYHIIAALWFILPLLYAYIYSVNLSPFSETPIFLFTLPFLLITLFSFLNPDRKIVNFSAIGILIAIGIFSTIGEKKYYSTYHYAETKGIAKKTIEYNSKYKLENITSVINVTSPYYIDYYLEKYGNTQKFQQYKNDGHTDIIKLSEIIEKSTTPFFLYAWSGVFNPHETDDLISAKYPYIIENTDYNGLAGIRLYGKIDNGKVIKRKVPVYYVFNGFEDGNAWDKDTSAITTENAKYDKHALKISPKDVYGPSCTNIFSRMNDKPIKNIRVSMWTFCEKIPKDAQIVATISFKDEDNQIFENYFWLSSKLEYFVKKGTWGQAFFSFNLPALKSINDELKIYVWNPDKNTIFIDNFELKAFVED